MSWFAVIDEDGKYWDFEGMDDYRKPLSATDRGRKWAEEVKANTGGSEIIEVVEKTAPIAVSEEEAEMLEQAKDDYCAASVISAYSTEHIGAMGQDRLMRAYVNGWKVKKPKRWNVKVPHTKTSIYFKPDVPEELGITAIGKTGNWVEFTDAEIKHYGLQDCEKVEVTE